MSAPEPSQTTSPSPVPAVPPRRLRWLWAVVVLALAGVAALSLWAWLVLPPDTLAARLAASAEQTWRLPPGEPGCAWWRLRLELDPALASLDDFILREGSAAAPLCELRYDAAARHLRLSRRHPLALPAGFAPAQAVLLLAIPCPAPPRLLVLRRRGDLLGITVDGVDQEVPDPGPLPAAVEWGFAARGEMGDSRLAVHLDARLGRHLQAQSDLAADARSRLAQLIHVGGGEAQDRALSVAAETGLTALGAHPQADALAVWLAWANARTALRPRWDDPEADDRLAEALAPLSSGEPSVLAAGLLASLLPALGQLALAEPPGPVPAALWLRHRQRLLGLLADAATTAAEVEGVGGADEIWELRLTACAARRLVGREPQPTPASAPPWVAVRWRLLAGTPLAQAELAEPPPPLPAAWRPGERFRPLLAALMAANGLERIADRNACARLRQAIADGDAAQIAAALDLCNPRERVLAGALLALRGLRPVDEARLALTAAEGGEAPWRDRDPLAWALSRLLDRRLPAESFFPRLLPEAPPPATLPATLARWEVLLAGGPGATAQATAPGRDAPPRIELLAAALAAQEAAGTAADWSLLTVASSPFLPLECCLPVPSPAPPASPVPPVTPAAP